MISLKVSSDLELLIKVKQFVGRQIVLGQAS